MSCGFDPTSYIMGKLSGGGGGGVEIESLSVTQNGTYTAPTGKAYSPVNVNVSGGGGTSVERKAVNFYDYEGTRLYSYTKEEFQNLTEMPENPSHEGLVAQGWNYTLEEAKTQTTTIGMCDIGQMYTTSDGKTHFYIHIEPKPMEFSLRFAQTVSRGVTVDWGDGSAPETFTSLSATTYLHTYAKGGDYVVTLDVTSGTMLFSGLSSTSIFGSTSTYRNRSHVWKAEIGDNVTSVGDYAFVYCTNLTSITIPFDVIIGSHAFDYCYVLPFVTIPRMTLPRSLSGAFRSCVTLKFVTIPNIFTAFGGTYGFDNCYSLENVIIPNGFTKITANLFSNCYNLDSITIPNSVNTIESNAFLNCCRVDEYHLLPTTPPILNNINAFNGNQGTIIYVPYSEDHSILEAYKSATNWSTYASYMQEEPQ